MYDNILRRKYCEINAVIILKHKAFVCDDNWLFGA